MLIVICTQRLFYKSKLVPPLIAAQLPIGGLALLLPFTPLGRWFGFSVIPVSLLLSRGVIMALYISLAEVTKPYFHPLVKF